jgi:hypothetical protein
VATVKSTPLPDVRSIALFGLATFEDPAFVRRALDLMLDGTIKQQDIGLYLRTIASGRVTRDVAVAWVESRLDDFAKVAPRFVMSDLPHVVASQCDATRVQAIAASLGPRLRAYEGVEQNLHKYIEAGLRCAALAAKERGATETWLSSGQSPVGAERH